MRIACRSVGKVRDETLEMADANGGAECDASESFVDSTDFEMGSWYYRVRFPVFLLSHLLVPYSVQATGCEIPRQHETRQMADFTSEKRRWPGRHKRFGKFLLSTVFLVESRMPGVSDDNSQGFGPRTLLLTADADDGPHCYICFL